MTMACTLHLHLACSTHASTPPPRPDSPVFGAAFLEPPFPPGLAISAGVYGEQEEAEVTLWEVGRGRYPTVGRLGWQLQAAQALRGLAGVLDCRQREGTTQVGWVGAQHVEGHLRCCACCAAALAHARLALQRATLLLGACSRSKALECG